MCTTQYSMQISLRWMRRMLVVILIISNFAAVMLADAAPAGRAARDFMVHAVPGASWGEGSNTYANAPGLDTPVSSSGAFPGVMGTTVDATSLVADNGTFSLAGLNDAILRFASRNTGANAPQSVITRR